MFNVKIYNETYSLQKLSDWADIKTGNTALHNVLTSTISYLLIVYRYIL